MSSSYPSPPNTPSPGRVGIDRDPARQNERPPTRARNYVPHTPPTNPPMTPPITPSKKGSAAAVKSRAVVGPMDPAALRTLLSLSNGKCGSPTKYERNRPCKNQNPDPSKIESQIRSMTTLTQASRELPDKLVRLAVLACCTHHIKPGPKADRIKVWKKVFPVGDEKAVPIEPIEDQIKDVLGCFPYTSTYTCIGTKRDRDSTACSFPIGGKRVRKGKKTVALIIRLEHYSHDQSLRFLLNVLACNMFCFHHTEQIPERVAKWKSRITAIYKTYPVQYRPLSSIDNKGLSRKFEGNPAEFWDDTNDTSAFITEIEKDRPADGLACYSLIRDKMLEPLKKPELAHGYVYVYEVEGNKGFVKIGYATQTIKARSAQWESKCDRVPKVLYPLGPTKKIPHANRVEGLCLAELKYRNMTVICEACPERHIEWVKVPAAEAIAVIQKWTKWIETAPFMDSKRRLSYWDVRNDITLWTLRDDEVRRTDDMSKFMREIAAAAVPRPVGKQSAGRETAEAVCGEQEFEKGDSGSCVCRKPELEKGDSGGCICRGQGL